MKEYYKCKRCYSVLSMRRVIRHHTQVHPDVPHDIYLDTFFDLQRPLLKCDFCSCKLTEKRLIKHLQRAHLFDNHSHKAKTLPFTHAVAAASSAEPVIVLSTDSEDESLPDHDINPKQLVEKAVQCDTMNGVKDRMVDKCIGVHHESKNAAVNTEKLKCKEVRTQTPKEMYVSPVSKRMKLSLEVDEEDGWVGLVLS